MSYFKQNSQTSQPDIFSILSTPELILTRNQSLFEGNEYLHNKQQNIHTINFHVDFEETNLKIIIDSHYSY